MKTLGFVGLEIIATFAAEVSGAVRMTERW